MPLPTLTYRRTLERLHVPALVLHANGDRVVPLSEGLELSPDRSTVPASSNWKAPITSCLPRNPRSSNFILEASAFANEALQAQTRRCGRPEDPATGNDPMRRFPYTPNAVMENLPPDVALERVDPFLMQATALVRDERRNGSDDFRERSSSRRLARLGRSKDMLHLPAGPRSRCASSRCAIAIAMTGVRAAAGHRHRDRQPGTSTRSFGGARRAGVRGPYAEPGVAARSRGGNRQDPGIGRRLRQYGSAGSASFYRNTRRTSGSLK